MAGESSKGNSHNSHIGEESSVRGQEHHMHQEQEMASELIQDKAFTAEEVTNLAGVGVFQVKLIILSGFVWMARGFEIIVLRFVGTLLTCDWKLKRWQGAVMTTVTFLCTVLGCLLYGIWSDRYGRRMALSSSLTFVFVFGAVSAGLRTYTWFILFRTVAAFGSGGLVQSLVLCCEYLPGRQRGRAVYILSCFWGLGALIMMYVQYATKENEHGWRIFTAIGVLPAFIAMVLMRFFPESFRFLLVRRQFLAANNMAVEMVESNGKTLKGPLEPLPRPYSKAKKLLLFPPYTRPTLLFWIMGLTTSITFTGLNFLTQRFLPRETEADYRSTNATSSNFLGDLYSPIPCAVTFPQDKFILHVWTMALDFPGFIIYMLLVDVLDRKKLMCASYLISSLFIFFLCIPSAGLIVYIIFIYIARILLLGQFGLLLLMTAETFPTSHRGTAVGLETSSFYLGQLLSSYVAESLWKVDSLLPMPVFGVFCFLCLVAAALLQQETRGKELHDVIKQ